MDRLRFGTGGIPHSSKDTSTEGGIGRVRELGLGAMELEFVRSVSISEAKAPTVRELARKLDVVLTVHAPYFVNLASKERLKVEASIGRILKSARIGNLCGAVSVTFHAAFFQKRDPSKVFLEVRKGLEKIARTLAAEGNDIRIRPELSGRGSQFGSLEELIDISSQVERVRPCIDFAHLHAREGWFNSRKEFGAVLEALENGLGRDILDDMHIHASGIKYGPKGELSHLNLKDSDMNHGALMEALRDFGVKGVLVCESPNLEEDALLMKGFYESLPGS